MYIGEDKFNNWMQRLTSKLDELGRDLKTLVNTHNILDDNEKILDNQDLAFLLKVSYRSLQRYRDKGILPFFKVEGRVYYRATDIRVFVKHYSSSATVRWVEPISEDKV
ncbi:helix-turn-helix protein [Dysgonomonas alginatilytica]|uniref:Helix-turn-helix protein n=1 Tax=Dysgonomonas alginatilytica TaxID=1605892 RepID=A0A2V3PJW7_9BACT|nr:helix-turn-helix domain-containing protein [Dysgonomonas alginatilytica]PXV60111.1 helix-turn-helix protein [Dysgonomonas alginatilytica]